MLKEGGMRVALTIKGYRPEVISTLVPFGEEQLWEMNVIDDATFGRFVEGPEAMSSLHAASFKEANTALKTLGRTNPTFAVNMAERYKKDPAGYKQMMDNLSKSMNSDPALSQKIAHMAKEGKVKELTSLADDYQNDPGATYARVMGKEQPKTPTTATVIQAPKTKGPEQKTATAPSGIVKTGAKSGPKGQKKEQKSPASVPLEESLGQGESLADAPKAETGPLTADQAKERFNKMMQDPNNEMAKEIRRNGVEGDVLKRLEKNPNLVKNFGLPVNADEYRGLLSQGKKQDFLNSFGGPDLPKEGMQANILGGLGEIGETLGGLFEGLFSRGGALGSFSGLFNQAKSLFSRLFGGGNIGILGTGKNLTQMLNNPNNPRQDPEYLNGYAKRLGADLNSSHPDIRKHAQEKLAEMGINDRGQLHELQQGRLEISHVGIEAVKGPDGTMKNVPTAHVKKIKSLDELQSEPAANDPSMTPSRQVAGSDITPGSPARPLVEPVPPVPTGGTAGG